MNKNNIRNFAIIAHIDHGKSTLADRIMEMTDTVASRDLKEQLLDDMSVEKAHNVTVKSRTVRNLYHADDGSDYELNLIDTPGHVDFAYEVSRSLSACEGVILLVDATQGVQAQTVANFRLAKKMGLVIIPVLNKVDSESADIERTEAQVRSLDKSMQDSHFLHISAKTGYHVRSVLEAVVKEVPPPQGSHEEILKALVFDSIYDAYKGIILLVRVVDGRFSAGEKLSLIAGQVTFQPKEIGIFTPYATAVDILDTGEVGYIATGLKDTKYMRVGDTLTLADNPANELLPGYQPVQQMVFAGFYPKDCDYKELKSALEKLSLNDPSFTFAEENSDALGAGFRCGFLGVFHLQIICERLQEEYGVNVLTTAPNVSYHVYVKKENQAPEMVVVDNPGKFPYFGDVAYVEEPFVTAEITVPEENMSEVMQLAYEYRGTLLSTNNDEGLIVLTYSMPLAQIVFDFFNKLKASSHGYATLHTEFRDYEQSDVVKVEVNVNYAPVDALSFVVYRQDAPAMTKELVEKLKYTMPRKLYPTPVQAVVEGKSIARVDVPPLRKNAAVSGEIHTVSKKQALLRRQNKNKRRAAHEAIEIPQSVFNAILEI